MITVAILINGNPLVARSARNTGDKKGKKVRYRTDCRKNVWHNPDDGAVALAKKLLDCIEE